MRAVLILMLIAAAAFVIFIIAPAAVATAVMFSRKAGESFETRDLTGTYYESYIGRIRRSLAWYSGRKTESISLRAWDGTRLNASLYRNSGKKLALFMHGYRSTPLNNFAAPGKVLYEQGFSLLFPEERGELTSGGRNVGMGRLEYRDVFDWLKYAEEELGAEEILLYGASMGASAIAYASETIPREKVKAMVLDSGFVSPRAQIRREIRRRHLPGILIIFCALTARIFYRIRIDADTRDALKKTQIPALFMHGTADTTVPAAETAANYEACASEKELFIVDNAPHTMAFTEAGTRAEDKLKGFLNKYF